MAIDGKKNTAWTTLRYLNNPKLGLLKPGVGLVVDLGKPVQVGSVKLWLQGKPTAVELRMPAKTSKDQAPLRTIKEWRVTAKNPKAGQNLSLSPDKPVTTRYVLVYLTSLPSTGGSNYRGAIAEIEVYSP